MATSFVCPRTRVNRGPDFERDERSWTGEKMLRRVPYDRRRNKTWLNFHGNERSRRVGCLRDPLVNLRPFLRTNNGKPLEMKCTSGEDQNLKPVREGHIEVVLRLDETRKGEGEETTHAGQIRNNYHNITILRTISPVPCSLFEESSSHWALRGC